MYFIETPTKPRFEKIISTINMQKIIEINGKYHENGVYILYGRLTLTQNALQSNING